VKFGYNSVMNEGRKPILTDVDNLKDIVSVLVENEELERVGVNPHSPVLSERSFYDLRSLKSMHTRANLIKDLDFAGEVVLYNERNEKDVIFRKNNNH
jgi:hypothetical protein